MMKGGLIEMRSIGQYCFEDLSELLGSVRAKRVKKFREYVMNHSLDEARKYYEEFVHGRSVLEEDIRLHAQIQLKIISLRV